MLPQGTRRTPHDDRTPHRVVQASEGQARMPGVSHVADDNWFVIVTIRALLLWGGPVVYSGSMGTKRRGEVGWRGKRTC